MNTRIVRCFFFFNDTATTEIYTLSLHDALPIWNGPLMLSDARKLASRRRLPLRPNRSLRGGCSSAPARPACPQRGSLRTARSEEHTSEIQSRQYLVCRLLLDKKKRVASLPNVIY